MGCCSSRQMATAGAPHRVSVPASAHDQLTPGPRAHITEEGAHNQSPPLTRSQALTKRKEFWETAPAYGGRQEVWDALKAACEAEDTGMGHAIIESAGITLPNGTLHLAYDELGNEYEIPEYCFKLPPSAQEDGPAEDGTDSGEDDAKHNAPALSASKQDILDTTHGEPQKVKILLSSGTKVSLEVGSEDPLERVRLMLERDHNVRASQVMLVFLGKGVNPSARVCDLNLQANDVLQAFVFPS